MYGDTAIWFLDWPRRVHKCGYFLLFFLLQFFTDSILVIPFIFVPCFACSDCWRLILSLGRRFLPMRFVVFCSTVRIGRFAVVQLLEVMSKWLTSLIFISLLLKHLYFLFFSELFYNILGLADMICFGFCGNYEALWRFCVR